jgi:hypothetical protein
LLNEHLNIQQEIVTNTYNSREKDYSNPFRKMTYETEEEMNAVLGDLENNSFIKDQANALDQTKKQVQQVKRKWKLTL